MIMSIQFRMDLLLMLLLNLQPQQSSIILSCLENISDGVFLKFNAIGYMVYVLEIGPS